MKGRVLASLLAAAISGAAIAQAPAAIDAVTAGELVIEPATLIALGFEWYVAGDDDGNAAVAVSYRQKGATAWRQALPFVRINRIDLSGQYGPAVPKERRPNLLAGSIIDLTPDTDYDVRLVMTDPDGAGGVVDRIVAVRTRAEPKPAPGGRVFHIYPPDHKGPVLQPAFIGLPAAFYDSNNVAADHFDVFPPRVRPGDTILVHAGLYKDDWHYYGTSSAAIPASSEWPKEPSCCGATFHGTYFLTASGTADKPIVIKGAGDGEAIFDGDGNAEIFNVMGANHLYFEGLTFRNSKVAIQAGRKGIAGAVGLTVKHSKFHDVGDGIHSDWGGSANFYIADNEFTGRDDPAVLVPWSLGMAAGVTGPRLRALGIVKEQTQLRSEYAVKVYGSGNVVAFNRVRNFHDGIDHATYGNPDNWPDTPRDRMPVANDFYNNDISNMHDDCIEADGVAYNFRVLRNRCVNAAGSAISTQGTHTGPIYIVGNFVYHVPGNFAAIKTAGAEGLRVYNNTFVAAALRSSFGGSDDSDFRNNLVLAEFPDEPAFTFASTARGFPTSDYNGYSAGASARAPIVRQAAGGGPGQKPAETLYPTLAAFTSATGQDARSRLVGYDTFEHLMPTDPVKVTQVYDPDGVDFRLRRRGAAIDAGTVLPNVTDGYKGRAPDLGALELGAAMPHFGPR